MVLVVQDVLIDGGVQLVALPPSAMYQVVTAMNQFGLDFDDAYQYVAAEQCQATLVSFDRDFDKTPHGRHAPAQVLAAM